MLEAGTVRRRLATMPINASASPRLYEKSLVTSSACSAPDAWSNTAL